MNEIVQFNAGELKEFSGIGNFFRVLSATDTLDIYFYYRGKEVSYAGAVNIGYWEEFKEGRLFDKVALYSPNAQIIQFATRFGSTVGYDKPPVGNVAVTNSAGPYTRLVDTPTSAAVKTLAAANAGRRYLLVQNTDASNYVRLRLDGTNPTTATGIRIAPGGYWESPALFAPTGDVKVIAETGSAICEGLEG